MKAEPNRLIPLKPRENLLELFIEVSFKSNQKFSNKVDVQRMRKDSLEGSGLQMPFNFPFSSRYMR